MIITAAAATAITVAKIGSIALTAAKIIGASSAGYIIGKGVVVGGSKVVEKTAKKVNDFMK